MFFRHREHNNSPLGPLFTLFRLLLSLTMMGVLMLLVYTAYRGFSGLDPVKLSPQAIFQNILASESLYNLLSSLLTTSPGESLNKAKEVLNNGGSGSSKELKFKFAIVADSHDDNHNLSKALNTAKSEGVKFIIGLGDYSDVGTIDQLKAAKLQFDGISVPYYLTAGDHDLWDSRDKGNPPIKNFTEVFGSPYQSFAFENLRIILFYNSDNYLGVDSVQREWIEDELTRAEEGGYDLVFAMTGIPLYHPSSDHVMGKTEPKLKTQAEHFTKLFKDSGVSEVFAADAHLFARYEEPKSKLKMTSVGAITVERNLQSPRFVIIDIFEDGSYNVRDIEIK